MAEDKIEHARLAIFVSLFQLGARFVDNIDPKVLGLMETGVMERRQSERKRIAAIVYLCVTGQRFQRCMAYDLSAGGAFVETDLLSVRRGRKVQLVFVLMVDGVIKLRRVPAMVAWVSRGGAGMLLHSRLPVRRGRNPTQHSSL